MSGVTGAAGDGETGVGWTGVGFGAELLLKLHVEQECQHKSGGSVCVCVCERERDGGGVPFSQVLPLPTFKLHPCE